MRFVCATSWLDAFEPSTFAEAGTEEPLTAVTAGVYAPVTDTCGVQFVVTVEEQGRLTPGPTFGCAIASTDKNRIRTQSFVFMAFSLSTKMPPAGAPWRRR